LGGGSGESVVGGKGAVSRFGAVPVGLDTQFFRLATGQVGVVGVGCPAKLVFQHGGGAGGGIADAVFDVGQGAHGELQAVGEVGAVAVAQRDATAHDVVAGQGQGILVHERIITNHE